MQVFLPEPGTMTETEYTSRRDFELPGRFLLVQLDDHLSCRRPKEVLINEATLTREVHVECGPWFSNLKRSLRSFKDHVYAGADNATAQDGLRGALKLRLRYGGVTKLNPLRATLVEVALFAGQPGKLSSLNVWGIG